MTSLDHKTKGMIDTINEIPVPFRPLIEARIQDRIHMIEAGVSRGEFFNERLREIDKLLRARWDFEEHCWAIDRYVAEVGCWLRLMLWESGLDYRVLDILREGDMQRFRSPEDYLRYKRAKAEARQIQKAKEAKEKVKEAVDSLSSRSVKQFLDVEKARHTGETIVSHGSDLTFLHRTMEREKKEAYQQESKGEKQ